MISRLGKPFMTIDGAETNGEDALDALNTWHRKKTANCRPRVMALSIRKASKRPMPAKNGAMTAKKAKGRKRHIAVDTLGNLIGGAGA
jgi:hypothetical protein